MNLEKAPSILFRSFSPNKPYHVQWMLTRKCNYRCRGCNVWLEQDPRELSTEQIKRGLDILKELGTIEVVLTGGNPLLRDDIDEIIEYASRLFITTIYDNGSMAAKKIEILKKADFVAISLDSLDPKKNDFIKGVKGSWKTGMQTIKKLKKEGVRVSVTPTISQLNLYEIVNLTNYFLEKKIPLWYCLYSYDRVDDGNQLFRIGKKIDDCLITDKKAMINLCNSLISMKRKDSNILMTTKLLQTIKKLYSNNARTWKCKALDNFLIIDHLGQVSGCHLHKPATSIFDLPKLWESKKFDKLRESYKKCQKCTYLCYIFYSIHGNVLGNLQIAKDRWKSVKMFLKI